jgi:hypothetical protein
LTPLGFLSPRSSILDGGGGGTIWDASKSSCDSLRSRQEKNFVEAKKFGSSAAELHTQR